MRPLAILAVCALSIAGCADDRGTGDAGGGPPPGADASVATDGATPGPDAASPPGGGGIGDPCTTNADCTDPPDAECFTVIENPISGGVVAEFPGGFCSRGCEGIEDCGGGADVTCASSSSSGGGSSTSLMYCTIACSGPEDCRASEGYTCQTIFGFGWCAPP
ncbi:MAG: hypothetical protein KC619_07395 [Myxococcales bacterium]|nr:hypothetical protein [Myxococcales bacterium]